MIIRTEFYRVLAIVLLLFGAACKGSAAIDIIDLTPGPLQWTAEAYAKAANAAASNQYGFSVAVDGDTAVIGAINEGGSGAAYVLRRSGDTWSQEAYLKAPNAGGGDNFGYSVAISGDSIVIGATGEDSSSQVVINGTTSAADNGASQSGAAYVFHRSGSTWTQEAYLKAANAEANDTFGYSVSISGDTIAVGAIGEQSGLTMIELSAPFTSNNLASSAGAVYIYKRTGTNWAFEAYLKAPNAGANDAFGNSVSIAGDTVVAGAYTEDNSIAAIVNGGSITEGAAATDSGAAYVFKRTLTNWAFESYLKASNTDAGDRFGISVSVSGDSIAVGADGESSSQFFISNGSSGSTNNSRSNSGAVYIFRRTGTNWSEEAYIKPSNTETGDRFGTAVAISGDAVAVGSEIEASNLTGIIVGETVPFVNGAPSSGAVYLFRRSGTTWAHEAFFKSGNSESNDLFGGSVALSGNLLITGARQEDGPAGIQPGSGAGAGNSLANSGAAYIFALKNSR